MPYSALAATRLLCFSLALLSLLFTGSLVLAAAVPLHLKVGGLASGFSLALIWVWGYRRSHFPALLEPVEAGCLALVNILTPSTLVLAPLFGILFRSLYGPPLRTAVRVFLYVGALAIVVAPQEEPLVGRIVGLSVAGAGMQFIKYLLERQEASEEGFRLLEGAKDYAAFMLDRHGLPRSWNSGAERLLGYTAHEAVGRPLQFPNLELGGANGVENRLAEATRLGSLTFEGWHRRRGEEDVFLELAVTAVHDHRGRHAGFSVIVRDVTERRESAAALGESQERLRAAVAVAPMVLWAVDRTGFITVCEGGRLGGLGLDPDELLGRHVEVLAREHPQLLEHNRRALNGESVVSTIEREDLAFEMHYSPLRNDEGDIVGTIGVATDITDHDIAGRLQASLLPGSLPEVPNVSTAVRYRPGAAGATVGGDWYDMLLLSNGRVGFFMGDVVGRGVAAASLMAKLRSALLVTAFEIEEPAKVLTRLNSVMPQLTPGQIATAVYCVFDPWAGTLAFAGAGHPPPLIVNPAGIATFPQGAESLPLGALAFTQYSDNFVHLSPDATLLLYTDGLVERRGESLWKRLNLLRAIASSAPQDLEAFCDRILGSMGEGGSAEDDVALLAARFRPPSDRLSLDVPATPEALGSVRDQVRLWLGWSGADKREAYRLLVACGEACSNAVEHAYRPGEGRLRLSGLIRGDVAELTIEDDGRWRERRGEERGRGAALMKSLADSVEVVSDESGTRIRLRKHLRRGGGP